MGREGGKGEGKVQAIWSAATAACMSFCGRGFDFSTE